MNAPDSAHLAACADYVDRFIAVWQRPQAQMLAAMLTPSARATAPLTPEARGRQEITRSFANALELMPGMSAQVHDWAPHRDGVFIEFTLSATLGRRALQWDAVDRFLLDGSLASERVTYFDSLPLLGLALRTPRAWPSLVRARAWPRGGAVAVAEPCPDLPAADAPGEAERFVAGIAARAAQPLAGDPPGLSASVIRWGARGDSVFIELQYLLPLGSRVIRWNALRRFQLRQGAAAVVRSYEDRLVRLHRLPTLPLFIPRLLRTPLAPL